MGLYTILDSMLIELSYKKSGDRGFRPQRAVGLYDFMGHQRDDLFFDTVR